MANLKDIINIVKFSQVEIIGSKVDEQLKYFSDIDMQEFIKTNKTYSDILKFFQDIFKEVQETPDLYLTDFKSGEYKGKALKWSYDEMMRGYKEFENKLKIKFEDTLTSPSVIKLDLVSYIDDQWIEVTTNYYFDFKNRGKTYKELSDDELKTKLLYDKRLLMTDNDVYKALKRLYSYYDFKGNKKGKEELVKLFNSSVGHLNKLVNGLKTISLLINNEKKPLKDDIIKGINKLKNNIKEYKKVPLLDNLDNKTLSQIDERVNKTIKDLSEIVNKETEKYILSLK